MLREAASGREECVHGIGKCLGVLQKFLRGGLEEGEITLVVVELRVSGLWRLRRETEWGERIRQRSV
jgi:hypothetical protein